MPSRAQAASIATLLVFLAPHEALSQARADSARRDTTATKLKAISVTATRAAGLVGGASAVIVTPTELRSSPAPLLEQALREAPFVHVRQNSRGEMELSVRGSDSRQAAVMLDGVPMTLGWDHRADPSLIPVTGSQSLVIVRGLGSLLNGPNTLGGTIEVAHTDAVVETSGGNWWLGGGIDENAAVVSTLGGARRFADVAGGSLSLQGGVGYRKRDGFTLPNGAADSSSDDGLRTNSDLRHKDGFALVRWSNAMRRSVGLTLSAFDAERGVPPEEHIAAPRLWRYPYSRRAVAALSLSSGAFTTPFGLGTFDVGLGYNAGKLKIESFSDRTYTSITGEELGYERTWTQRARLSHSLGRATLKAALTLADVRYEETLAPDPAVNYRQQLWSTGAEIEAPLGDRTTISGGVVYDRSSTPETGGRASQEPLDNIGWRAGLSRDFSDMWRAHASVSQRARFPALRELYSGALNRFMPNPDLKPETLLGFETGLIMNAASATTSSTVQLIGFRHNLEDAVVRITLPPPDRRFRRINRDRLESSGVELLAGFVFGTDRARAVTLHGDALLQNITIRDQTVAGEPTRHAENNPETRGTIELGVPLPLALRAIGNARYTGTQFCLNADTGNEMRLASQVESDVAVERNFAMLGRGGFSALRVLVSLDNVGDAVVFDQCGLPQPGRTLRLMFSLR
ncbi:MAG: TonB-dependent receptor plug domain-containing protein [Gemmatimonadaceae bacterium]